MGRGSSVPSHSLRLSRSLLPPTRAGGREQRRQYMVVCRTGINYIHESVYIHWSSDKLHSASMELESRNIEEKRWSWFRGKGRDTDKKFDGGGRVEIDAVDGGEELVQR
ncbi:hypothetical protein F2Q69_00013864 [Brassica cretica]|uniref:Uncharacterized protein n=1 Tax=Brassica cretica TaxID=69181 RepID=A0A8S9R7S4_BRACR|nr:hypothetical protein F2Q69_00013864 [Brassica cretica]